MGVENIVNVTITRQGQSVSQAGFGTPLILGTNAAFAERSREYTSLTSVASDFADTTDEYKAAQAIFAQTPKPKKLRVGRKAADPETYTQALDAIKAENNDWYGLILTSRVEADVLAVAGWVEASGKVFITASDDPDTLTPNADVDLAYKVKAANYTRTFVFYHETPAQFIDAALMGRFFAVNPGKEIAKFLTLAGITVSPLTDSQKSNALAKRCNTYTTVGGVAIVEDGVMGSGQFLDTTRNLDYLQARMQEAVYGLLVRVNKISYTDAGVAVLVAEMKGVLKRMVREGILAEDPAPAVQAPKVADVSTNDRAGRILPDVGFTAKEAGAIQSADIAGVVSV